MGIVRQALAAERVVARVREGIRAVPPIPAGQPAAARDMQEVKDELRRLRTVVEEPDPLLVPENL